MLASLDKPLLARRFRRRLLPFALVVIGAGVVWAQSNPPPNHAPSPPNATADAPPPRIAVTNLDKGDPAAIGLVAPTVARPQDKYGWFVIAPAAIAIVLAILMRSAAAALSIGVIVGGYMMVPCLPPDQRISDNYIIAGVRVALERYVVNAFVEPDELKIKGHVLIVLFTLTIGALIGVININGGTRALVNRVARFAAGPRRAQLATWFAGLIVFFDDYANSMIIGPTMQPMYDRLRVSRAKLAYIVDSTAAPVASIALVGTWLGTELGYIQDGLNIVADSAGGTPAFLANISSMDAFLYSIPYRFYAILALWFVLVIALTGRDFGPMLRAESRALGRGLAGENGADSASKKSYASLAAVPILVLLFVTVGLLYLTGTAGMTAAEKASELELLDLVQAILSHANSYISIWYGAISALLVALLLTFLTRACPFGTAMDGALDGVARMMPAMVILLLAWSLSAVSKDLKLGDVLNSHLIRQDITWFGFSPAVLLPTLVFLSAAGTSFATGSSWATMGLLTPVTVQVAAGIGASMTPTDGTAMFFAAVGSVLAGSVFGDHCSPISDTTVLSSVASGCSVEEHTWTQIPYALVTAVVSLLAGSVYCAWFGTPPWIGIVFGAGILLLIVLIFGRKPKAPPPPPPHIPAERIDRRMA